jgi:hypothetical protein
MLIRLDLISSVSLLGILSKSLIVIQAIILETCILLLLLQFWYIKCIVVHFFSSTSSSFPGSMCVEREGHIVPKLSLNSSKVDLGTLLKDNRKTSKSKFLA